jgi:hypothetical protein
MSSLSTDSNEATEPVTETATARSRSITPPPRRGLRGAARILTTRTVPTEVAAAELRAIESKTLALKSERALGSDEDNDGDSNGDADVTGPWTSAVEGRQPYVPIGSSKVFDIHDFSTVTPLEKLISAVERWDISASICTEKHFKYVHEYICNAYKYVCMRIYIYVYVYVS